MRMYPSRGFPDTFCSRPQLLIVYLYFNEAKVRPIQVGAYVEQRHPRRLEKNHVLEARLLSGIRHVPSGIRRFVGESDSAVVGVHVPCYRRLPIRLGCVQNTATRPQVSAILSCSLLL